ncbi:tRNA-processing ribonuclease [Escherichia coli]|uniref:tRNA-processing ribonuclease n=1 Tax=Escherichia coli TaxID=562 RepID=A0A376MKK3_ECOLX|nr:tRNA-processing ribonuclease [Escherichia coli]
MAVDWPGDFHLRQLSAFLLDLLALAAPPSAQKSPDSRNISGCDCFEVIKIVMTYTLPSLMKSPSGAAFGSVLGLMAFFYFFARLTLFCAAWIATAEYKDDPRMPGKTQR